MVTGVHYISFMAHKEEPFPVMAILITLIKIAITENFLVQAAYVRNIPIWLWEKEKRKKDPNTVNKCVVNR